MYEREEKRKEGQNKGMKEARKKRHEGTRKGGRKTDTRIRVVVNAGIGPGIVVRYIKSQIQRSGAGQGD